MKHTRKPLKKLRKNRMELRRKEAQNDNVETKTVVRKNQSLDEDVSNSIPFEPLDQSSGNEQNIVEVKMVS